ncbi:MAG: DivIVA domain-containing protein [Emticicia sp.]|uniref:DivIVA domain-containing protein n=1 Tax=Emticicia sp. TaxID=1930953 RepID=UPI003BA4CD8B
MKILFFEYFSNRKGQRPTAQSSENVSEFPKTFLKMKITPLEIRQHEFEKTFRGYNIEEVDSFLGNLSQEWERVLNESKMLRMQLEIAEKEANKLREIEMTLFKTLKTAEDTSTMITEQANQQADKHLQEAKLEGEKFLMEAQQKANLIVRQAEERARYIKEEVLGDVKVLERDFRAMDHYKTNLLVQMRSLSTATLEHVQRFEDKFDKEGVEAKFKEATSMLTDEEQTNPEVIEPENAVDIIESVESEIAVVNETGEIVEPTTDSVEADIPSLLPEINHEIAEEAAPVNVQVTEPLVEEIIDEKIIVEELEIIEDTQVEMPEVPATIVSSSVNNYIEPEVEKTIPTPKADELDIIEGIGPKIAMLLYDSGIFTFRDLAITPVYKIQEILDNAGPQFARHDPSTWTQQAKLAAEGRWNDLEALKFYLVGGREPKKGEEAVEANINNQQLLEDTLVVEKPAFESNSVVEETSSTQSIVVDPNLEGHTSPSTQINPPVENNLESITEEMLEKVNKVKAAIRKAMVEKNDVQIKDNTPLPTLNDIIAKNESSTGSSFFDNL